MRQKVIGIGLLFMACALIMFALVGEAFNRQCHFEVFLFGICAVAFVTAEVWSFSLA